jgi:hypothetical protein
MPTETGSVMHAMQMMTAMVRRMSMITARTSAILGRSIPTATVAAMHVRMTTTVTAFPT